MEKQIPIRCIFTGEEDITKILLRSFDLHLARILAEELGFAG